MDLKWFKWTAYSLFKKSVQKVTLEKLQWQLIPNLRDHTELQLLFFFGHVFQLKQCEFKGIHLTMTVIEHSGEAESTSFDIISFRMRVKRITLHVPA